MQEGYSNMTLVTVWGPARGVSVSVGLLRLQGSGGGCEGGCV